MPASDQTRSIAATSWHSKNTSLLAAFTSDTLDEQFHGHMNRGVMLLAARMKTLTDLDELSSGARELAAAH
jgi:hypothetical protein